MLPYRQTAADFFLFFDFLDMTTWPHAKDASAATFSRRRHFRYYYLLDVEYRRNSRAVFFDTHASRLIAFHRLAREQLLFCAGGSPFLDRYYDAFIRAAQRLLTQ